MLEERLKVGNPALNIVTCTRLYDLRGKTKIQSRIKLLVSSYLFATAEGFDFEARPRAAKDALDAFQKEKRLHVRLQILFHRDDLNI